MSRDTAPAAIPVTVHVMDGLSRLLWWAAWAWVCMVLGQQLLALLRSPIQRVIVTGDTTHQSEHVLRPYLSAIEHADFWRLPLAPVAQSLEDAPWVRHVGLQRDFPKRLRIHIEEHQAAAWWGEAGGNRLLNTYGEVFEAPLTEDERAKQHWPVLNGPAERSADILRAYVSLRELLDAHALRISELSLSPHGAWHAVLNDSIQLALGRAAPSQWASQVTPMLQTLPALRARYDQALRSIDLRYPNGFAVSLSGISVGPKL